MQSKIIVQVLAWPKGKTRFFWTLTENTRAALAIDDQAVPVGKVLTAKEIATFIQAH